MPIPVEVEFDAYYLPAIRQAGLKNRSFFISYVIGGGDGTDPKVPIYPVCSGEVMELPTHFWF